MVKNWGVGRWGAVAAAALGVLSKQFRYGSSLDKDAVVELFRNMSDRLGYWAVPVYVGVHTLTLALCLPYAVFFEAGASLLFGFLPAVLCVFSAKVLGASLSFWIGRIVFRSSSTAIDWARRNKYFNLLSKGVERDGWRFVVLARFSPIPSYVINYGLAATKVGFLVDFLLPTVIGCLPMILQNTSIGSLAGAAVASTSGSQKSKTKRYGLSPIVVIDPIFVDGNTGLTSKSSKGACFLQKMGIRPINIKVMIINSPEGFNTKKVNRKRLSVADEFWHASWDGTAKDRHDEIRNELVYGWLGASIYGFKTGQFGDSGFVQCCQQKNESRSPLEGYQRRSKAGSCTKP